MSPDPIRIRALVALTALLLGAAVPCRAQTEWAVGDRVEVEVNMASDPAYQSWKAGTITGIQVWQGRVSGIFVRTDDGLEVTSAERFMRPGPPASSGGGTSGSGAAPVREETASTEAAASTVVVAPTGAGSSNDSASDPGTGNCRVGTRVTDRDGRSGVVVRATGPSCHVKLDGVAEEGYYLQWMLRPEGATEAAVRGGALETGSYTCWTANGAAGTLRLVILDGATYTDGNGSRGAYAYEPSTDRIEWKSGPWGGFYGTKLGPGKIGISSRPGGFSNTTCDRK